jgi:hypothetical protein
MDLGRLQKAKQFNELGYVVIKNLINNPEHYYKRLKSIEPNRDDEWFPEVPSFSNDDVIISLHSEVEEKIEELLNMELERTYNYCRIYNKNDKLRLHKDRAACEISITLALDYKGDKPWDIWLADYDEEVHAVSLEPGDALLYRGTDLLHWRDSNPNEESTQAFLHYVNAKGEYSMYAGDFNNEKFIEKPYKVNNSKFKEPLKMLGVVFDGSREKAYDDVDCTKSDVVLNDKEKEALRMMGCNI